MRALRIGALLLACSLAACGHTHKVTVAPAVVPPPPPARPLVSVPGPAELPEYPVPELKPGTDAEAAPASGGTGAGSQTQQAAATSETPAATSEAAAATASNASPPPPEVDPEKLVGLNETEAMNLLGPPAEKTDAPPSRVWTYRSPACDVKLFFYPEVGGTLYRTLTYEITDRDPTDTSHGACVGGLVKAHAG
jgi:hypothetical protein